MNEDEVHEVGAKARIPRIPRRTPASRKKSRGNTMMNRIIILISLLASSCQPETKDAKPAPSPTSPTLTQYKIFDGYQLLGAYHDESIKKFIFVVHSLHSPHAPRHIKTTRSSYYLKINGKKYMLNQQDVMISGSHTGSQHNIEEFWIQDYTDAQGEVITDLINAKTATFGMDIIENQKKVQWEAETPVLIIDQADQSNEEKAVATNNEKDTMSNPEDAKALADIEKYGCHILRVMEEGDEPPFSYTIGMRKSSHHPDLIVVGLSQELSHSILNEYSRRVKAGEKFIDGDTVSGFLEGFDCQLKKVNKKHHKNYLGWALWLYKKEDFEYLQLVYPNTQGVWPWDPKAKPAFVQIQPLLQ